MAGQRRNNRVGSTAGGKGGRTGGNVRGTANHVTASQTRVITPVDPTPVEVEVRAPALGGRFVGHPVAGGQHPGEAAETWFVTGAIDGERVLAKRTRVRKGIVEARVLEVLQPAAERVEPPCEYAGTCGGCTWQHLPAAGQSLRKRALCERSLAAIGIKLDRWRDAPALLGYRRRARFHYERRGDDLVLGVHPEQSHAVVDVRRCVVLDPALDRAVQMVRRLAPLLPKRGEVHALSHRGEVVLGLHGVRTYEQLLKEARALLSDELVGITFRIDRVRKVVGRGWLAIDGEEHPAVAHSGASERGGPPALRCGPFSFAQANASISAELVADARELCAAQPATQGALLELFAGSGNFTRALWSLGRDVIAVEQDHDASTSLAELVRREGAPVRVVQSDAGRALHHLWEDAVAVGSVLLDPPRGGLAPALLDDLVTMAPHQIVMVSCDFMTLRRDLEALRAAGYQVTHAIGYDMMPMTAQMELLIELSKVVSAP